MQDRYGKESGINRFEISDISSILEKFNNGHVNERFRFRFGFKSLVK